MGATRPPWFRVWGVGNAAVAALLVAVVAHAGAGELDSPSEAERTERLELLGFYPGQRLSEVRQRFPDLMTRVTRVDAGEQPRPAAEPLIIGITGWLVGTDHVLPADSIIELNFNGDGHLYRLSGTLEPIPDCATLIQEAAEANGPSEVAEGGYAQWRLISAQSRQVLEIDCDRGLALVHLGDGDLRRQFLAEIQARLDAARRLYGPKPRQGLP